ncbi:MAG TPA: carboxypeptidase-like regulatory domain-containing protein, partial [Blastocatellia bacterium]|nr:carboxypeptidase-like regulatory domain-containing protein [Blastocatellia bacterium]
SAPPVGETRMRPTRRVVFFLALVLAGHPPMLQAFPTQDQEKGAISGRVMLEGKPAAGVIVAATPQPSDRTKIVEQMLKPPTPARATTDSDGRYTIENLPFGKYRVGVSSKVLIDANAGEAGLEINVTDNTTVEKVDFSLQRSGVITGRITDSEGRPVIGEQITLKSTAAKGTAAAAALDRMQAVFSAGSDRMFYTDDRGVYRIFGVRPGSYIVSAGRSEDSMYDVFLRRPRRARTFYPGVSDEAAARPVDVAAGAEVSGIDIKLGIADKGFVVSGRVIDAEARTPIADAVVAYTKAAAPKPGDKDDNEDDDELDFSFAGSVTTTNARGEFRFESVPPGNYKAEANSIGTITGTSDYYADPLNFQVQYANVDKLEIKIHRGASISGVVVVENADRPDALEDLVGFMLYGSVTDAQTNASSQAMARVSSDLTFRMSGLKPGKVKIGAVSYGQQKFAVLRVERNGSAVPDGIELQGNEQITGVRVILTPANCVIRGHVTVQGVIQRDSTITVFAASRASFSFATATVDSKGDFVLENLAPGTYEVTAQVGGLAGPPGSSVHQTVTVGTGATVDIALVLDLKAKGKDN